MQKVNGVRGLDRRRKCAWGRTLELVSHLLLLVGNGENYDEEGKVHVR